MILNDVWVVFDGEGNPVFCAGWSQACHEHINELLDSRLDEAKGYVVRELHVKQKHLDVYF